MGRFNLLGGQINLLGGQMPTQLTFYLPPWYFGMKVIIDFIVQWQKPSYDAMLLKWATCRVFYRWVHGLTKTNDVLKKKNDIIALRKHRRAPKWLVYVLWTYRTFHFEKEWV